MSRCIVSPRGSQNSLESPNLILWKWIRKLCFSHRVKENQTGIKLLVVWRYVSSLTGRFSITFQSAINWKTIEFLEKKPCNKCGKRPLRKLNLQHQDICLHLHHADRQINWWIDTELSNLGFYKPNQETYSLCGDPFLNVSSLQLSKINTKELNVIINYILHQQFSLYTISHVWTLLLSIWVGKTCLSCSEESRALNKISAAAGDSSWLKPNLYAPATRGAAEIHARDYERKQKLQKTSAQA